MQLQEETGDARKYRGVLSCMRLMASEEGVTSLWRGNLTGCWLWICYGAVQFSTFETLQKWHLPMVASGSLAGVAATITTYPLDLMRTRLVAQVLAMH